MFLAAQTLQMSVSFLSHLSFISFTAGRVSFFFLKLPRMVMHWNLVLHIPYAWNGLLENIHLPKISPFRSLLRSHFLSNLLHLSYFKLQLATTGIPAPWFYLFILHYFLNLFIYSFTYFFKCLIGKYLCYKNVIWKEYTKLYISFDPNQA